MYTSSDSEPDASLLALLRAHLSGNASNAPAPPPTTHVLRDAEHVADTALDVALDMVGCKRAAGEVAERMRRRRYGRGVWRTHALHPGRVGEGRGRFVLGAGREVDSRVDNVVNEEIKIPSQEPVEDEVVGETQVEDTAAEDSDQTLVHSTPNNEAEADAQVDITNGIQALEIQTEGSSLNMSGFLEKVATVEEPLPNFTADTIPGTQLESNSTTKTGISTVGTNDPALLISKNKELDDDELLHWVFTIDLLNFSFWTDKVDNAGWSIAYRGQHFDGYWGLCAAIWRALDAGIPIISPAYWASDACTESAVRSIFRSETPIELPLLAERFGFLKQAADVLADDFNNSLPALLRAADGSAARLVNLLAAHFSCFRDEARHEGRTVRFLKRAQIFAADLWAAFDGEAHGKFADVDEITMFADYRVPQMLHALGALWYSPTLEGAIKKGEEIKAGGTWEVEIRGCSIWCVELIRREIKRAHPDMQVNAILIDFFLYDTIKEAEEEEGSEAEFPHHRTRTVWY